MAKRKKVTRQQVQREITRIRNIVRQAEQEGYIFGKDVIPKNVNTTVSTLNRLRSISREDLLKNARRFDVETGEILDTATEKSIRKRKEQRERKRRQREDNYRRKQQKKHSTQEYENDNDTGYPLFSDIIINTWYEQLQKFSCGEGYHLLLAWSNTMIQENGRQAFAEAIQRGSENGEMITWTVVYNTSEAVQYIGAITSYISEQGIFYNDKTMDRVEFMLNLGRAFEEEESFYLPEYYE